MPAKYAIVKISFTALSSSWPTGSIWVARRRRRGFIHSTTAMRGEQESNFSIWPGRVHQADVRQADSLGDSYSGQGDPRVEG